MEQLQRVEQLNGRAALVVIVVGVVVGVVEEGLTGFGITHQIRLGKLWATGVFAAAEPTNPPKQHFWADWLSSLVIWVGFWLYSSVLNLSTPL